MARMRVVLAAAGLDFSHVVEAKVYRTDMADFPAMNAAYRKHFPGPPPARTTVGVSDLHRESRVELTLMARRPR
jgi:2-iminobutanoate/2-iminopropanoate deaminase